MVGSALARLLRVFLFSVLNFLRVLLFRKSVLLGSVGLHLLHLLLVGLHVRCMVRVQLC